NWYDSASLAPLQPRYVSTVDSANLAGALFAVAEGLRHMDEASSDGARRSLAIADTRALFQQSLEKLGTSRRSPVIPEHMRSSLRELAALETHPPDDQTGPARIAAAASALSAALEALDLDSLATDDAKDVDYWGKAILDLLSDSPTPGPRAEWNERRSALAQRAEALAYGMDFRFLYDRD